MPEPPPVQPRIEEPTFDRTPRFTVPEPVFDPINEPVETALVAQTIDPEAIIGPATEPIATPPPIRLVGRNVFPDVDSFYPPQARRGNVEGTALVRACVDERARLDGTPVVETSTGSELLDTAAIRVARQGRYARSMRGEEAVPNCHRFRVTFTLTGSR